MKNQESNQSPSIQKDASKGSSKKDAINLSNIKIDLSKGNASLLNKEDAGSSKSIYKGLEDMNSEEKKKFRSKIRRELRKFINAILGKDRSDAERNASIKDFIAFYKNHWIIQDFRFESFSNARDAMDIKDIKDLLSYLKSILG